LINQSTVVVEVAQQLFSSRQTSSVIQRKLATASG